MTTRLGHINIKTPLYEETLAFYEMVLDLHRTPALTMADQQRNAWLANADGQPIIHVNTADTPALPGTPAFLDHVAFECDDVAAIRVRLDAAGIRYTHVAKPTLPIEQIFFLDPNGIKIELTFAVHHQVA